MELKLESWCGPGLSLVECECRLFLRFSSNRVGYIILFLGLTFTARTSSSGFCLWCPKQQPQQQQREQQQRRQPRRRCQCWQRSRRRCCRSESQAKNRNRNQKRQLHHKQKGRNDVFKLVTPCPPHTPTLRPQTLHRAEGGEKKKRSILALATP